jgi:hypothetical protein
LRHFLQPKQIEVGVFRTLLSNSRLWFVRSSKKSIEQPRAGASGDAARLQFELAEAKDRAKRAEQWLVQSRQLVAGRLMRSSAAGIAARPQHP